MTNDTTISNASVDLPNPHERVEIVVTFHGQGGTWRAAYRSEVLALRGIEVECANGAACAGVHRRKPKIYTPDAYPELY